MEGYFQTEEKKQDEGYGLLGSLIKNLPGYEKAKASSSKFSSGLKRKVSDDHGPAGSQQPKGRNLLLTSKPTVEEVTAPFRPHLPSINSTLESSDSNTPFNSNKASQINVPALENGLGKLDGASRGSYASGSRNNRAKHSFNRAAPSESKDQSFPISSTSKKAKTGSTNTRRPSRAVEAKVVALRSRAEREQGGNEVQQARPDSSIGRQRMVVKGTGNATKMSKRKGKAEKEAPAESVIISLDEDTDEDIISEDNVAISQSAKSNASLNLGEGFPVLEKSKGGSPHRQSPNKSAIQSRTESIESIVLTGAGTSPGAPIIETRNILPAPPLVNEDFGTFRNGISTEHRWEATGYAIMPVETTGFVIPHGQTLDTSPTKLRQDTGSLPLATGHAPHSHIVYSLPSMEPDAARSRSKQNPLPIPDPKIGRPEWIDEPPQIHRHEINLFRQIPSNLQIPFVALADELDNVDEPSGINNTSLAYLDFRGWSAQGVPTHEGGPNIDLDHRHVVAAQRVWRAFRSAQILREEAGGRIFRFSRIPSPSGQETQRELDGVSVAVPIKQETFPLPRSQVTRAAASSLAPLRDGKPQVYALSNTPKQRHPVEVAESPEIIVQAAPANDIDQRIDRLGSQEKWKARPQAHVDDIESPIERFRAEHDEKSSLSEEEITCMN
ncbi:hypothetical protein NliqN6_6213 [Naganishia liquefaciens]|uniref:Uncharacterized protein n=1 Tax=Naganishia liquefaciens TaxID=104408 RepID=A0A8H3TZM2_9TREE|nr:hypothetical protein NliqN6_6213 [Naganishia liquefaciens]